MAGAGRQVIMTIISEWYARYLAAHNVPGLEIPFTAVKFYEHGDVVPPEVRAMEPSGLTLTSCQATKQASLGDSVCLTRENIGCVAAAISLGLVDQHQREPVGDALVYTEIMRDQSGQGDGFVPPSPEDFTSGRVAGLAIMDPVSEPAFSAKIPTLRLDSFHRACQATPDASLQYFREVHLSRSVQCHGAPGLRHGARPEAVMRGTPSRGPAPRT
jgi:hypothetical protein